MITPAYHYPALSEGRSRCDAAREGVRIAIRGVRAVYVHSRVQRDDAGRIIVTSSARTLARTIAQRAPALAIKVWPL